MAEQPDDVPIDEYVIKIRPIILECFHLTIDYITRDAKASSGAFCIFHAMIIYKIKSCDTKCPKTFGTIQPESFLVQS